MSIGAIQNAHRLQAAMAAQALSPPRVGLVTSYDPENYLVKVMVQPTGPETGWIPVVTLLAGNGFGVYAGPANGDQAAVVFQEGSVEVGFCIGFLPSTEDQPPRVETGEILIRHQTGSLLNFKNDGTAVLAAGGCTITLANGIAAFDCIVTAAGDITDNVPGNAVSMAAHRTAYDAHHHTLVKAGTDVSGPTDMPV